MKKTNFLLTASLAAGLITAGAAFNIGNKVLKVRADGNVVSTNLATYYSECPSAPDANYYKNLIADTDYPLGDGSIVNMRVANGGANTIPQVRNYHNEGVNYYIYIKYNSTHNAVGQTGAELTFNASNNHLLDSVTLRSGYQVNDAFKIQIYDQSTHTYVDDVVDQMFASSGATYNYDFSVPTTSFKIVHYLHSTSDHSLIAWKETDVEYEDAYSLVFDSQGGSEVESQTYAIGSGDVTVEPSDPTRPNEGPTSYTFAGWYTNPECTDGNEFVFGSELDAPTTVYAKWDSETLSGYTITYDTQGGSVVSSETVPTDGTLFTKPSNPTKASDDLYDYTFHNWYTTPECVTKFDFKTVPTGDVTVYAGYSQKAHIPDGSKQIDPKYNIGTWGAGLTDKYYPLDINTRGTIDKGTSYPAMRWTATSNGSDNSGIKNVSNESFEVNDTTMTFRITDPQKYFSLFRVEFYVKTYNPSKKQLITLTTGAVESDSGYSPYDSLSNSDLVLVGNCSTKPQEFTFSIGNVAATGTRLRYIYAIFGTYTTSEQVVNYATVFNDDNVCGLTANDGLNESKWEAQATAYDALSSEAKSALTNYDGDNAEVLECLERYDRVVYLHGESYDFMGRVAAGKVAPKAMGLGNVELTNNINNGALVAILVGVSSLIGVASFFAIKRKKEN